MKKIVLIGALALALIVSLFAGARLVSAQQLVPGPAIQAGPGGPRGGYGPMHEYMVAAFADLLDLTLEEIDERLAGGETMWDIAISEGYSADEIPGLMLQARSAALEAMVADGLITQEQAEQMAAHMQSMHQNGRGPGFCHGAGGRSPGWSGGMGMGHGFGAGMGGARMHHRGAPAN